MKNVNEERVVAEIVEGIYIPSIECCWLYKAAMENEDNNYVVEEKYLDKILNGKIDWSFELVKNPYLQDNIDVKYIDGKAYTLDIINVKYNKKYINKKEEIAVNTLDLRIWSYNNGFKFNNNLMKNWKRGSGKARVGDNLFMLNTIVDKSLVWARMDLDFTGEVDIASVRAYESLTLSSLIGTIKFDPKNILVIDDYESKFNWKMSKTWLEGEQLHTENVMMEESNSIWDGEGLLSKKIFEDNEIIKGKGVALLRNRYMKCAGFSCDLEAYYIDYCNSIGADYETFTVTDMFGKEIFVKDIELITTPSAIKIAKFQEEVTRKGYVGEGAWLTYWKERCGTTFGVCKTEHQSHFVSDDGIPKNRLSYQMVNTIPFTKSELSQLVAPEIAYVNKLKNDLDFFLAEVNSIDNSFIDDDEEITKGNQIDVTSAFVAMSHKNSDFQHTQVFKDYRRNFINSYVNKIRTGKILIDSADYCVACGNPVELLNATVGKFDGISELKGNQLYCSRFNNGEDVVGFRNPHVNEGNIGIQVNKYIDDIHTYMNDTENIVFLNSIDYPILSTYQGEDFDIDSNLLTNNTIIVEACKNIGKDKTLIPKNCIKGENVRRELNALNMCIVDKAIAQNYIGQVINLSQEINSKFNHLRYNKLEAQAELDELYKQSSRLSSISCCEIDKAKKQFAKLKIIKELEIIKKDMEFISAEDKRRIKPNFFRYIGDNSADKQRQITNKKHRRDLDAPIIKQYCADNNVNLEEIKKDKEAYKKLLDKSELLELLKVNDSIQKDWIEAQYTKMDTPMDWLQEELDKIADKKGRNATVHVAKLLKENKNKVNHEKVDNVVRKINSLDFMNKAVMGNSELSRKEKHDKVTSNKYNAAKYIKDQKLTKADIVAVMKKCLNTVKHKSNRIDKKSGIESISLEVLFITFGDSLLQLFK
ncbi:hypothetical protein [Clostridium grantii]|uniref:Uncharacterized protein n=1 Tax=Clostridium grantii DSM 8605 TaxID=1121316 RepID=A0A1M5SDS1_9CLOT|nr:hypothetical protein [Clostridium grantii]SHH36580.1 hypothetical protein SAMN02745207_00881 [Clostridium grantii DSM 8605]